MLDLSIYRQQQARLADLVPWACLIEPGIILNKDGSFQQTFLIEGLDLENSTDEAINATLSRLNNILKRLGNGWVAYFESQRQPTDNYLNNLNNINIKNNINNNILTALIDAERREQFAIPNQNFVNYYYLTLQFLPPSEVNTRFAGLFIKSPVKKNYYQQYLALFKERVQQVVNLFALIAKIIQPLSDEEILTYLHTTVSHSRQKINLPDIPIDLDCLLTDTPLINGVAPQLGENYLGIVSILAFPQESFALILDQLNRLGLSYRWMTRFIFIDSLEAEQLLKSYRRRWFAKRKGLLQLLQEMISRGESRLINHTAIEKSTEIDQALSSLSQNKISFGYYTSTIILYNRDLEILKNNIELVENAIQQRGFTTVRENYNAIEAWLSTIPGQAYANVRAPLIHTLNLTHLIPFAASWSGDDKYNNYNKNNKPFLQFHTPYKTPFIMPRLVDGVGHQLILGPTGSGKSVLLNFMALQFLNDNNNYNSQIFIFDKGGSFLASTLGVGGNYYTFENQHPELAISFQPLQQIDQLIERKWASEWLQFLLFNEKIDYASHDQQIIWQALSSLAEMPSTQRTLTGLQALLQDQRLRTALTNYTLQGPYGDIFDNDSEFKNLNNNNINNHTANWHCYELSALMTRPAIITPVLTYLFHKIEKNFNGAPTLLILDEAWLFLDHPLFSAKIRGWLKSLRKQNVSVIFATQSIDDALERSFTATLLESCSSRIFLPNAHALEPAVRLFYEKLGLNQKQLVTITQAIPQQQYYYQSSQGNCLFDLQLAAIANAFCTVNQAKEQQAIHTICTENKNYFDFLINYFNYKKLPWAAEFINNIKI